MIILRLKVSPPPPPACGIKDARGWTLVSACRCLAWNNAGSSLVAREAKRNSVEVFEDTVGKRLTIGALGLVPTNVESRDCIEPDKNGIE